MKTKKVRLYADLYPGWHERWDSEIYVSATTKPYDYPGDNYKRVAIDVELPIIEKPVPVEAVVEGAATLEGQQ